MKILKWLKPICILIFINSSLSAQIDNPIAGDVLKLLDLLQKDYSTVADEVKTQELRRDRGEVLNVFKKYMLKTDEHIFHDQFLNFYKKELEKNKKELTKLQRELESLEKSIQAMNISNHSAITHFDTLQKKINDKDTLKLEKQLSIETIHANIDLKLFDLLAIKYVDNHYVKHQLEKYKAKFEDIQNDNFDTYSSAGSSVSTQKSLPFLGGSFDLQTLIDGLSRFIADRMKAELTNAFISKVQKWLDDGNDEGLMAFKILMPKTTNYILAFEANDLNYFSTTIKDNLEVDFNSLISNIGGLRALPSIKLELQNNPELNFAFEAVEFIPQLKKIVHPNDFFIFLNNSSLVKEWAKTTSPVPEKNIANGIKFTTLMVNSLTVKENNLVRFINLEEISRHYKDPNFFMLFFGFLQQQNENYYDIEFNSNKLSVLLAKLSKSALEPSILESAPEKAEFLFESMTSVSNESQKLAKRIQDIKKASKLDKKVGRDTIIDLMRNFVGFFKNTAQTVDLISKELTDNTGVTFNPGTSSNMNKYLLVAERSIDVVDNLFHKRYANSIFSAMSIVNEVFDRKETGIDLVNLVLEDTKRLKSYSSTHKKIISGKSYDVNHSFLNNLNKLKEMLFEVKVLAFNTLPEGNTTRTKIEAAYNDLLRVEQSTAKTKPRPDSTKFKELADDTGFQQLFTKSILKSMNWDGIGARYKEELQKIEINGHQIFTPIELNKLELELNKLSQAVFQYAYLGDKSRLEYFQSYFSSIATNHLVINYVEEFNINPKLKRLIYFINDISKSEDAEQVQSALENFALPVGSYSIKQKSALNVSLGTAPGVLFSFSEKIDADETKSNDPVNGIDPANGIGFTAPVGISIATGSIFQGWSIGVFAPIIDIGALTHYRFDSNNNSEALPNVSLRNIMAVGAHLQLGIKGAPLLISCGWQTGPQIRKVDSSVEGGFRSIDSSRWSVGLTVDIPIMNLYTKPK